MRRIAPPIGAGPPSRSRWPRTLGSALVLLLLLRGVSAACVGDACMLVWATADGGGALAMEWDFAHKKVQTFRSFCAAGQCLYSTIDPGIMTSGEPHDAYFNVADGTAVRMEVVTIDPAITLRIDGAPLKQVGDSALLGRPPTLHTHPSWQLSVADGALGDYGLSFKLTTDSPLYGESEVYSVAITNLPTPTPDAPSPTPTGTPSPSQTPTTQPCAGDCNGDGTVAVNELVLGVSSALDGQLRCPACDRNGDGAIGIGELVAAVNMALAGCPAPPTPTTPPAATLAEIQRTIFSPRCAIPTCHDSTSHAGALVLEDGHSHAALVGVPPDTFVAQQAGLLRVDAGHPENSFLLIKLEGPSPDQGSRMPLTGDPLTAAQIDQIRRWILAGAPR